MFTQRSVLHSNPLVQLRHSSMSGSGVTSEDFMSAKAVRPLGFWSKLGFCRA